MIKYTSLNQITIKSNSVAVLGKFDGVHLGHQELLRFAKQTAEKLCCPLVAITLNLKSDNRLSTDSERSQKLEALGVDIELNLDLNDIRNIKAEDFIKEILVNKLKLKAIAVGTDSRFGYKGKGNSQLLKDYGLIYGFDVIVLPKLEIDGVVVSSSLIRDRISKGDVQKATDLLGIIDKKY